jgi:hypothetical protein
MIKLPFIDFESKSYLDWNEACLKQNKEDLHRIRYRAPEYTRKVMDLIDCYRPYTGRDGLQSPKTLDGSYYDMLGSSQIADRDRDQVILKWFDRTRRKEYYDEPFRYMSQYGLPVPMYEHMSFKSYGEFLFQSLQLTMNSTISMS